ncbi:unnamed protein product, partial [Ectocarpus sp. 12 AP-2014]
IDLSVFDDPDIDYPDIGTCPTNSPVTPAPITDDTPAPTVREPPSPTPIPTLLEEPPTPSPVGSPDPPSPSPLAIGPLALGCYEDDREDR